MKIYFLGTNGWFDTPTGNTTCVLMETDTAYIILDAGNGFYKLHDIISDNKPIYLFLTHLHMDHICGLQTILLMPWKQGITIITPQDMRAELLAIMRPPFMRTPEQHPIPVTVQEVQDISPTLPFKLDYLKLQHSVPATGYRIEDEGKIIAFALDTGTCDNLIKLAKNADLLITECSFLPGQQPNNFHLNPQDAAQAAITANTKALALIHLAANVYTTFEQRDDALTAAGFIFPHTMVPYDGDIIKV